MVCECLWDTNCVLSTYLCVHLSVQLAHCACIRRVQALPPPVKTAVLHLLTTLQPCSQAVKLANPVYCSGHRTRTHLTLSTIRCVHGGKYVLVWCLCTYIGSQMPIHSMKRWIKKPSHARIPCLQCATHINLGWKISVNDPAPQGMLHGTTTVDSSMPDECHQQHVQPCMNYIAACHTWYTAWRPLNIFL